MGYSTDFQEDINRIKGKYSYFKIDEMISQKHIIHILDQLQLNDNVKKAVLAIDLSMRTQNVITENNKDTSVLSSDLLAALYYEYIAMHFDSNVFKKLNDMVKLRNEWSEDEQTAVQKKKEIDYIFLKPFMAEKDFNMLVK